MVAAMGQKMTPLSAKMTNGDPARAQADAHSALIGLFSPLVNAHAESSTYPFTETGFPEALLPANRLPSAITARRAICFGILISFTPILVRFSGQNSLGPRRYQVYKTVQ